MKQATKSFAQQGSAGLVTANELAACHDNN
jgi:hypothetical protein